MKTKNLLRKTLLLAMLIALVLIGTSSCRKWGADYIPVQPGPSPAGIPDVFPNKPLNIMTDLEIANHAAFPASILPKLGHTVGIEKGEGLGLGLHIGGLLFDIFDHYSVKADFKEVDDQLDAITGQISTLSAAITTMGDNLQIDVNDLTSFIVSGDLNQQIGLVNSAMAPGLSSGFMYYSSTAALWYSDSTKQSNILLMNAAAAAVPGYADAIYNAPLESSMTTIINEMYQDIVPAVGSGVNALSAYEKTLVPKCRGKIHNSTDAMNAYTILESYFLTVVNYQFQAAIIMLNACNVKDPTGIYSKDSLFWYGDVVPVIVPEVQCFLSTVDSLVANIYEYRDTSLFKHDMGYAASGLAPDILFGNVMARSQLVANQIYDALNIPYPVMCGHVLIPQAYAFNAYGPLNLIIGPNAVSAYPLNIKASQIPYTVWDQNNTCHPGYSWNSYRFECYDTPDTPWPDGKMHIQVNDNSSLDPWVHYPAITGYVTMKYYNPSDLSQQPSLTKTTTCTMKFGYFSAAWPWGTMLLSNSQITAGWKKLPHPFDFSNFNKSLDGNSLTVPFEATGSKGSLKKVAANNFSYPYNTAGNMWWSGITPAQSNYYAIADAWLLDISTGTESTPDKEPGVTDTLQAWGYFDMHYNMPVDTTGFVNIGTVCTGSSHSYVSGNVVYTKFPKLKAGDTICRFGSTKVNINAKYTPGVQYYFETPGFPVSVAASMKFQQGFQFVYRGYSLVH